MGDLTIGGRAPNFSLQDQDCVVHELSFIHADFVVLYFYPEDDTPGCTLEGKEFSDRLDKFYSLGAHVFAISGKNTESKKKFCEKYGLRQHLLADEKFEVCKKYNVYGKKKFMGKEYLGINRTTFVIDKDKKIIRIFENVKPLGHAKEVFDYISSL